MSQPRQDTAFTFTDPDGFKVFVRKWVPPQGIQPKAVVQIAPGGDCRYGQGNSRRND
jgi:hypothetical protein